MIITGTVSGCDAWKSLKDFGEAKLDTRFYIASIVPDGEKTLTAVRQHWGIENQLHWTLDVTFREMSLAYEQKLRLKILLSCDILR